MPDQAKDFEFLLAIVKSGSLTVDYEGAMAMLGWNKKKCVNKMSEFRKEYDWPINKNAPTAAKGAKSKGVKRAAKDETSEGEGEAGAEIAKPVKKQPAKRAKTKKVSEEVVVDGDEEEGMDA